MIDLYRDFIDWLVDQYRDNTALICKKQPGITYGELNGACNALAAGLHGLGMSKGDTIAVCLGNSYHTRQMFWTAAKGGFVVALINTRLSPREAAYIINDSSAEALVTSRALGNVAAALPPRISNPESVNRTAGASFAESRALNVRSELSMVTL